MKRGENQSTLGKSSQNREENQQCTQPTYDARFTNQIQDTLVGGKHSHHCAIPTPLAELRAHVGYSITWAKKGCATEQGLLY